MRLYAGLRNNAGALHRLNDFVHLLIEPLARYLGTEGMAHVNKTAPMLDSRLVRELKLREVFPVARKSPRGEAAAARRHLSGSRNSTWDEPLARQVPYLCPLNIFTRSLVAG